MSYTKFEAKNCPTTLVPASLTECRNHINAALLMTYYPIPMLYSNPVMAINFKSPTASVLAALHGTHSLLWSPVYIQHKTCKAVASKLNTLPHGGLLSAERLANFGATGGIMRGRSSQRRVSFSTFCCLGASVPLCVSFPSDYSLFLLRLIHEDETTRQVPESQCMLFFLQSRDRSPCGQHRAVGGLGIQSAYTARADRDRRRKETTRTGA